MFDEATERVIAEPYHGQPVEQPLPVPEISIKWDQNLGSFSEKQILVWLDAYREVSLDPLLHKENYRLWNTVASYVMERHQAKGLGFNPDVTPEEFSKRSDKKKTLEQNLPKILWFLLNQQIRKLLSGVLIKIKQTKV